MYDYLLGCLGLFNDSFNAIWGVPILRFFLLALLLSVVVALLGTLSHAARK